MPDVTLEQKSGIGSHPTQIGVQNNTIGLGYSDVKEIFADLFKSELSAFNMANERYEKLLHTIIELISTEKISEEEILEAFKDPDFQYVYIDAQKSFIRAGTDDLQNILSQLLLKRIKEKERSLLQLTLNESFNIVPMLLPTQMDILSLCFILRYCSPVDVDSLDTFKKYITKRILPHVHGEIKKDSLYQHLEYTRGGKITAHSMMLERKFANDFSGLFLKGFQYKEFEFLHSKYPDLFIKCLNNNSLLQINALNEKTLDNKLLKYTNIEDKELIKNLYKQNVMSEDKIKNVIIQLVPESEILFDIWNNSKIKFLELTSVGIAIGATYSKQITDTNYNLSIWI